MLKKKKGHVHGNAIHPQQPSDFFTVHHGASSGVYVGQESMSADRGQR